MQLVWDQSPISKTLFNFFLNDIASETNKIIIIIIVIVIVIISIIIIIIIIICLWMNSNLFFWSKNKMHVLWW